jgi:hypothetical protein
VSGGCNYGAVQNVLVKITNYIYTKSTIYASGEFRENCLMQISGGWPLWYGAALGKWRNFEWFV